LGKSVVEALRQAGAVVESHDDHFAQDAPDEDWIPDVSRRGWVILAKDKNIRRWRGEREAVLVLGARVFTLCSGNLRGAEMARLFVRHIAEMEALAAGLAPPFVAVVGQNGIEVVYPTSDPPAG